VIAYSDGTRDLINLADTIGADALECSDIAEKLVEHDLLGLVN
jgi:aminopeptidase-like protein